MKVFGYFYLGLDGLLVESITHDLSAILRNSLIEKLNPLFIKPLLVTRQIKDLLHPFWPRLVFHLHHLAKGFFNR